MPVHGKKTRAYIGRYEISDRFREASATSGIDTADTTTFGDETKEFIIGWEEGTISLGGLFDGSPESIDEVGNVMTSRPTPMPVVLCYQPGSGNNGEVVRGDIVDVIGAVETNYTKSSPVADVVSVSIDAQASGGVNTGRALTNYNTEFTGTTITNHPSVDFGAATPTTTRGFVAAIMLLSNTKTSGNVNVKIQQSADNTVFTDVAGGALPATAFGQQTELFVIGGGTMQRYFRLVVDLTGTSASGSVKVFAAISRK